MFFPLIFPKAHPSQTNKQTPEFVLFVGGTFVSLVDAREAASTCRAKTATAQLWPAHREGVYNCVEEYRAMRAMRATRTERAATVDEITRALRALCVRDKYKIYRAITSDPGVMEFAAEHRSEREAQEVVRLDFRASRRRPTRRLRALTAEEFLES